MTTMRQYLPAIGYMWLVGCAQAPAPYDPSRQHIEYKQLAIVDAQEWAAKLPQLFPLTAACDTRTNVIILRGPPDAVDAAIKLLDQAEAILIDDSWLYGPVIFIKHLQHAQVGELVPVLEDMVHRGAFFDSRDKDAVKPLFIAYERTNALIVKVDRSDEDSIRKTIEDLDAVPGK